MEDKILNKYMKEGSSSIPKGAKKKIKDGLSMLVTKKGGGPLKDVSPDNVGLSKLPEGVRNRMGFKKYGGKITYKMTGGQVVDASYD
jgi:hypothetical protein